MGIKEPPLESLLLGPLPLQNTEVARTYMMFSHTVKGQTYNIPLLSAFLSPSPDEHQLLPTVIDYELLTNDTDGKRTVGFGWYAGGKLFLGDLQIKFVLNKRISGWCSRITLFYGTSPP